jgi:hypothetical protein
VIKQDSDYVTTISTVPYSDSQTIVFLKKGVMMVLSNAGSAGEQYTITIPMQSASVNTAGTEYTDIIACGKVKIASTGDFVTTIVNGMPQVTSLAINLTVGMVSFVVISNSWIYLWSSSWK